MKSASKVKIGQIVHHMVLFLKRSRHLGYLDYVVCYSGSKSVWDANIGFQASVTQETFCNSQTGKLLGIFPIIGKCLGQHFPLMGNDW